MTPSYHIFVIQVEVPVKMAGTINIIGPKGQNFRRLEAKTAWCNEIKVCTWT